MKCSERELYSRFDSRELYRWSVYYSIEPFGWEQETRYFGTLATLLSKEGLGDLAGVRNWFTDELPDLTASVAREDDDA